MLQSTNGLKTQKEKTYNFKHPVVPWTVKKGPAEENWPIGGILRLSAANLAT